MSTLRYHLGKHSIELGGWYERNNNTQARRWYPLNANNPTTPYERQQNALIDQYTNNFYTNTFVTHLQDNWQISKNFSLMAGFKSELVYTNGTLPVAAKPGSLSPSYAVTAPGGEIDAAKPFLPAFGAVWDITKHEQWFANIQENMRSFQDAGYGNATPWGATSQAAFEEFKKNGKPETSWTYETGLREHRQIHLGPLTAIEGQVEYYHVHFSNRLLAVATKQRAELLALCSRVQPEPARLHARWHSARRSGLRQLQRSLSAARSHQREHRIGFGFVRCRCAWHSLHVQPWRNAPVHHAGPAEEARRADRAGFRKLVYVPHLRPPRYG